jgi:hypothetical protein
MSRTPRVAPRLLGLAPWLLSAVAQAQGTLPAIEGTRLQKLANGVVGVMSYTVAPDVTTSSLTISNGSSSSTDLSLTPMALPLANCLSNHRHSAVLMADTRHTVATR